MIYLKYKVLINSLLKRTYITKNTYMNSIIQALIYLVIGSFYSTLFAHSQIKLIKRITKYKPFGCHSCLSHHIVLIISLLNNYGIYSFGLAIIAYYLSNFIYEKTIKF